MTRGIICEYPLEEGHVPAFKPISMVFDKTQIIDAIEHSMNSATSCLAYCLGKSATAALQGMLCICTSRKL